MATWRRLFMGHRSLYRQRPSLGLIWRMTFEWPWIKIEEGEDIRWLYVFGFVWRWMR